MNQASTGSGPSGTAASEPLGFDGGSSYAVKLPTFEGPLDLLLHLIRLNEVEITAIPVASICEQYLAYLEWMRELEIDLAAEYLVMAATLAWIKSGMLLPPSGDEETEEGPDPREALVRRLLEYQRFKQAAQDLDDRPRLGRDVFASVPPQPDPPDEATREIAADLSDLLGALRDVLRQTPHSGAAHELFQEPITVRERMVAMMDALGTSDSLEFEALLRCGRDEAPTRPLVIATFLGILELARLGVLALYQGRSEVGAPEGPIHVRRRQEGETWNDRVSEWM